MSENEKTGEVTRNRKKKRRRIRRLITLVIVLVLVGGAGFLVFRKLQHDNTVTYDAYTTTVGTISNSLSYSGSMQLINNTTYTADAAAKVREIYVAVGDTVKEGEKLMRLSNGSVVTADFAGKVNKISVEKDQEVQKDTELIQIADFGNMQVSFRVGESDISQVSVGQSVRVTVASAGATFDSTVKSIDYASYSGNNVAYYTAVVDVDTSSTADIYPGMQATVTIPKEEVRDVVILKMDAVSTARDNSAFVYMLAEDGTMTEQPVTVGVSNGNYVEIKEGLQDGETVYVVAKAEETETSLFASLFGTQQVVNRPSMGGGSGSGGGNRSNWGGGSGGSGSGGGMPSGFSPNR